jgi:hypothetical protein
MKYYDERRDFLWLVVLVILAAVPAAGVRLYRLAAR